MQSPQKICPRCRTTAPLDATFCGQCGRQYRTQFTPPAAAAPSSSPFNPGPPSSVQPLSVSRSSLRTTVQITAACIVALCVLFGAGAFHRSGSEPTPSASSSLTSHGAVTVAPPAAADPTAEARSALESDPIEDAAKRAVERENQKLNLAPPAGSMDTDGRIHLRSGGTITRKQWDDASRKAQESPVFRNPPSPPPF